MENNREQFLNQLNEDSQHYRSKSQYLAAVQWCISIPVAIAGFLTTAAGLAGNKEMWLAQPVALVVWGLIAAVGTVINQIGNPMQRSEYYCKLKNAMNGISNALQVQGLSLKEAARLKTLASEDPEIAIEELTGREISDK